MEITTCEQYVVAELFKAQREIALLNEENAGLRQEIGDLNAELAKRDTPIERHIAAEGRSKTLGEVMYVRCTSVRRGDETLTFEQWCNDAMGWYTEACEKLYGMGEEGFIRYFEPELRAEYDARIAELRGDDAE